MPMPKRAPGRPRLLSQRAYDEYAQRMREGTSIYRLSVESGLSTAHFYRIAKAEGITFDESTTAHAKKMGAAHSTYAKERRIALNDRLFEAIQQSMDVLEDNIEAGQLDARDLQALVISYGILTDKRRLEDGESTSRDENVIMVTAKESLSLKLAEIRERQAAVSDAIPSGPQALPPPAIQNPPQYRNPQGEVTYGQDHLTDGPPAGLPRQQREAS